MPIFGRRHYEAIALTMQAVHPGDNPDCLNYDERLEMWRDIRNELALAFSRDNSRFAAERFKAACEPNANVKLRSRYTVAV